MFRILQGDVGSGKTIVSFIAAANVIRSGYQVVLMAPTEILAKQHFKLAKKLFKSCNVIIEFLSGKSKFHEKKLIQKKRKSKETKSALVDQEKNTSIAVEEQPKLFLSFSSIWIKGLSEWNWNDRCFNGFVGIFFW